MKIAIQITSIFIFRWQIFDKIFSNYYCSTTYYTNIPHWLSHISCRSADLTPGKQPRPVLSHSRSNRTIDHSLNKSLYLKTHLRPLKLIPRWISPVIAYNFSVWYAEHRDNALVLSSNTWNVWYLTGRTKVSQDHLAVIVPARTFTFNDEATRFGRDTIPGFYPVDLISHGALSYQPRKTLLLIRE